MTINMFEPNFLKNNSLKSEYQYQRIGLGSDVSELLLIDSEDESDLENYKRTMENRGIFDIVDVHRVRNKRLIMWGVGSILVITVLIIVYFSVNSETTPVSKSQKSTLEKITLDEVLTQAFYSRGFNGTWISDKEILYSDHFHDYHIFDVESKSSRLLLKTAGNPLLEGMSDLSLSPDGKYALIEKNPRKIYRHSYIADYVIFDFEKSLVRILQKDLQLAVWTPANAIIFVQNNNIFYVPNILQPAKSLQVTKSGIPGIIYNGVPDWVNEEEVFSSNKALWFSPSGMKMAFASFNDSLTRIMTIPYYGTPGDLMFQYPLEQHVRYPKAGSMNPEVGLHLVDLEKLGKTETAEIMDLEVPTTLTQSSPILSTAVWATDEALLAIWMNRIQNVAIIASYENKETPITVATLGNKLGWLELFEQPKVSKDGSQFLLITSVDVGNNSGIYPHITLFDRKENSTKTALTSGKFTVMEILNWDGDSIIYLSNSESDPAVQFINRVSSKSEPVCITCSLQLAETSAKCLYSTAAFSKSNSYFIFTCDGPGVPQSILYQTASLTPITIWEQNTEVRELVLKKNVPVIKRLQVPVGDKFQAEVKLIVPRDLDENKKYPMLVKVYAGPGSHQITEQFDMTWEKYLVSSHDFVVALIDGRGSNLKGQDMMYTVYKKLGTYEVYDQINVTRYLQNKFKWIDANRTAIWGWSYGGYATGLALALDKANVFRCGISVAPVTDWALYDSIYTERYMGLPTPNDNWIGYERAQLLNKFESLRHKKYFLIHGTMDDNVHYQQSLMLARKLERNDIMFRQLSYPDEDHGLVNVRPHLYHNLEDFLNNCLHFEKGEDW